MKQLLLSLPVCSHHALHPLLTPLVSDIYTPDKALEAEKVMGANDNAHPAVSYLHKQTKEFYVGGAVEAIQAPTHYDYVALRCK
jgi:ATP sulfurylase